MFIAFITQVNLLNSSRFHQCCGSLCYAFSFVPINRCVPSLKRLTKLKIRRSLQAVRSCQTDWQHQRIGKAGWKKKGNTDGTVSSLTSAETMTPPLVLSKLVPDQINAERSMSNIHDTSPSGENTPPPDNTSKYVQIILTEIKSAFCSGLA